VLLNYPKKRPFKANGSADGSLTIRLGLGRDPEALFQSLFGQYLTSHRLMHIETTRQGAALELTYRVRLLSVAGLTTLVSELNRTDGVQSVDLRID